MQFNEKYQIQPKPIGVGGFSQVYRALYKHTNQMVAIKMIKKLFWLIRKLMFEDHIFSFENQVNIIAQVLPPNQLDHPNVIKIYDSFQDQNGYYIVMQLMKGGQLLDRIIEREAFSQKEACLIIKHIVDAVRYCHDKKIVHRDLKPENILFDTGDQLSTLKIGDFGTAKIVGDQLMTTACGTPAYMAPQIISGQKYNQAVDYWSIGVILYVLVSGSLPFQSNNETQLYKTIQSGQYNFSEKIWLTVSYWAKDLIKNLLTTPAERYNAKQIFQHPWIVNDGVCDVKLVLNPALLNNLKKLKVTKKLKKTRTVIVATIRIARLTKKIVRKKMIIV